MVIKIDLIVIVVHIFLDNLPTDFTDPNESSWGYLSIVGPLVLTPEGLTLFHWYPRKELNPHLLGRNQVPCSLDHGGLVK